MREKIITELANIYTSDKTTVLSAIMNSNEIPRYRYETVKGKQVIKKDLLTESMKMKLDYYKLLINQTYRIKYPNRSYIMTEIMNILPHMHLYHTYTIYKFDFKSFFYTASMKKSTDFIKQDGTLRPNEINYLEKYRKKIKSFLPGIGLHNALIEISGKRFDEAMKASFKEQGILFYTRYVDDCIIIFDEIIEEDVLKEQIYKLMNEYFGKNLHLNDDKCEYYNSNMESYELNYLGYAFFKQRGERSSFKFGISNSKLEKYKKKLDYIILNYKENNNLEILEMRLESFYKRSVYYGKKKNSRIAAWQVRGITDSYKELRRVMRHNQDFSRITNETKNLFSRLIIISFERNQVEIPMSIKNHIKNNKYCSSFYNNKAVLMHPKIGLTHYELKKKLEILTDKNLENYSYNDLANDFIKEINIKN